MQHIVHPGGSKEEKKVGICLVELGQEIILQIFGNIKFRTAQKVSRALKGELERELGIKTFSTHKTFIRRV